MYRYHKGEHISITWLSDDEAAVEDSRQGLVHIVNHVGARVLEVADGHSLAEIADSIVEMYSADLEQVLKDVRKVLEDFAELKIITKIS